MIKKARIITDGSYSEETGMCVSCYKILDQHRRFIHKDCETFMDNDRKSSAAESRAIELAVEKAIGLGFENIHVATDATFIVNELRGERDGDGTHHEAQHVYDKYEDMLSVYAVSRGTVEEAHDLCAAEQRRLKRNI